MFNQNKYEKCIGHLIAIKSSIIICITLIFLGIGAVLGFLMVEAAEFDGIAIVISGIIGGVVGFFIGLSSTWKIDMQIQEAYWRIDMLNEFKKTNNFKLSKTKTKETKDSVETESEK